MMKPHPRQWIFTLALLFSALDNAIAQEPVITEFLADNRTGLMDGFGKTSDWIEIHNPSAQPLSLKGYVLRDESTDWQLPEVAVEAGGYVVFFASGAGEMDPQGFAHAPFGVSKDGESLSLLNPEGKVVSSYIEVPRQHPDISYGLDDEGNVAFFSQPTPGEPNQSAIAGFVADTKFSVKRGFFDEAFDLEITTETEGATIYYTVNGGDPRRGTLFNPAKTYVGPITIYKTTVLRAFAKKAGHVETNVDTQTYIFTKGVIRQPAEPEGFPSTWGEFTGTNGSVRGRPVPADYAMNAAIVDENPEAMESALKSLPTLSIVMNPADLFGENGILPNPFGAIDGSGVHRMDPFVSDRQTSVEWLDPNGGPEMQVDCGIRLSGGWSRHYIATPKKSFSLLFKKDFGPGKLNFPVFPGSPVEEFDRIALKAIFSNAWPDAARPPDYLRDHFTRQTRIDMGGPASHGTWVHLYLNGLYWGIYNPTERPDASYAAAHFGGNKADYDAVKHAGLGGPGQATTDRHEVIDGNDAQWQAVLTLARQGLEDTENYEAFKKLVDVENLADYAILNIYASNVDWPHKNWYANGRRGGNPGFRFFSWDAEYAWHDVAADRTTVSNRNTPAELYSRVRLNEEFQRLFGDRIQKHLFGNGALTEEASIERYTRMAAVIEPAIVAEAARWGDHGNTRQGTTNYTKANWESARDGILNNFLSKRHERALEQFANVNLYPKLEAPTFNRYGLEVEEGFALTMRSKDAKNLLKPSGGDIYYTTNGSDPRQEDNAVSPMAMLYEGPITLGGSSTIRARLRRENLFRGGEWSALTEARFLVGAVAADSSSFVLTKIHYRPPAPSSSEIEAGYTDRNDFEYVEFLNASENSIHLTGVHFTNGIEFRFDEFQVLAAGARLLLVRNEAAFRYRFGSGLPIAGVYAGRLSNGGETLTVAAGDGTILLEMTYDDRFPWPEAADGEGAALVRNDDGNPEGASDPARWTAALEEGSPGAEPVIKAADPGTPDAVLQAWLESRGLVELTASALLTFALARDLEGGKPYLTITPGESESEVVLVYQRRMDRGNVDFTVEASRNLETWVPVDVVEAETPADVAGVSEVRLEPVSRDLGNYFRLVVTAGN